MRVLVTGASGFVGAHTTLALTSGGHDVRLFVRSPQRLPAALGPVGLDANDFEVAVGDVTDPEQVRDAITGVDAVVHAAAVFSVDPRDREMMRRTNVAAADAVLTQAVHLGCDPVVHVSSIVALIRKAGGPIDRDSALGNLSGAYNESKVASDVVARNLQAHGSPVHRVHPPGILGPHDPHLGTTDRMLRDILRGRYPTWPRGRMGYGDVRDVAATISAVVDRPPTSPSAWISPTHTLSGSDYYGAIRQVTGRRIRHVDVPVSALTPFLAATAPLVRALPPSWELPLPESGSAQTFHPGNQFDDSATLAVLGVPRRDLTETLTDTIRWLVRDGHLRPSRAGLLGGP